MEKPAIGLSLKIFKTSKTKQNSLSDSQLQDLLKSELSKFKQTIESGILEESFDHKLDLSPSEDK